MAVTKLRARAISDNAVTASAILTDAVAADAIADNAVDIARLNVSDGSAGQFLKTDGSNGLSFGSVTIPASAYNAWLVKTSGYTAVAGDQLVCVSSSVFTITLPSGTTVGRSISLNNSGTASVTINRNSQPIGGVADNGVLQPDASTQLVYVNSTIGWKEL